MAKIADRISAIFEIEVNINYDEITRQAEVITGGKAYIDRLSLAEEEGRTRRPKKC